MIGFLYTQTEYSFLKSMNKISNIVEKAKEYNYKSLAINDNNMHGAYKFYKECIKNEIKPIIGLKVICSSESRVDSVLLAYAKNETGYKNLLKIASKQAIEKIVDIKYIENLSQDLIIVTPGIEGEIEKNILEGLYDEAKKVLLEYKKSFSNFYVGISLNTTLLINEVAYKLYDMASDCNIMCLPVNRCLYINKEDIEYYKYFRAIDNLTIEEVEGKYHLFNQDELEKLFYGYNDIFDNFEKFYNSIDIKISKVKHTLPVFPNDRKISSKELLSQLCFLGLKKRLNGIVKDEYINRLNYELDVISKMKYDDYFLIVYDFIRYAKKNKILVGPGRGSSAGSLVSYCLGITNVDPLKFDLLFERFLNPERISMPDIDIDFPDNKRDEVIKYVLNKYGKSHVCHISTFQRFKSRMAVRDICRVLKTDNMIVDEIISKINDDINLSTMLDSNLNILDKEEVRNIIKIASKVEGLPRQTGTHAAGIIISDDVLTDNTPISNGIDDLFQSQYEASDLEELGLLKIDFLGLKNLSTINDIVNLVNIDINKIPLNDKKTYELLGSADTLGVFQLESQGIRNVLKKLKPSNIMDIVAVLALYRPGPMDQIDEFIERKNGKKFSYVSNELEPILRQTYGIIVYQEQIMQISNVFAKYTLGEADVLRRAVSKKKLDVLENERKQFVEKSLLNNKTKEEANLIYDYIVKFANYGFNKSHSVAYSLVSYQMAYLKANYFKEFMVSLLNDNISINAKLTEYIYKCLSNNVLVVGPNINISTDKFIVHNSLIYFPFTGLKGFGYNNSNKIIEERKNGEFKSFEDFKKRIQFSDGLMQTLIFSGAFDEFGTKKSLIKKRDSDYDMIMSIIDKKEQKDNEFDFDYLVQQEKEAIGVNIKYSILSAFKDEIIKRKLTLLKDISFDTKRIIAIIKNIKEIKTKNGELMAFVKITDEIVNCECVIFPNCYKQLKNKIKCGIIVEMRVKVEHKKDEKSLIVEEALVLGK